MRNPEIWFGKTLRSCIIPLLWQVHAHTDNKRKETISVLCPVSIAEKYEQIYINNISSFSKTSLLWYWSLSSLNWAVIEYAQWDGQSVVRNVLGEHSLVGLEHKIWPAGSSKPADTNKQHSLKPLQPSHMAHRFTLLSGYMKSPI